MAHALRSLEIVLLSMLFAVVYGVLHDQITARVCVEYFTVGHPPLFATEDPTLLGIGWGIAATWWVGLIMGVPLACAALFGNLPPRLPASLILPLAVLMVSAGVCALLAGLIGFGLAKVGLVFLVGPIAKELPADRHVPFIADLWAHSASYLVGFAGGLVLIVWVWWSRVLAARVKRTV